MSNGRTANLAAKITCDDIFAAEKVSRSLSEKATAAERRWASAPGSAKRCEEAMLARRIAKEASKLLGMAWRAKIGHRPARAAGYLERFWAWVGRFAR